MMASKHPGRDLKFLFKQENFLGIQWANFIPYILTLITFDAATIFSQFLGDVGVQPKLRNLLFAK